MRPLRAPRLCGLAIACLLPVSGCGGDGAADATFGDSVAEGPGQEETADVPAGTPRLLIGTGGVGRWEDLPQDGVALLARGCQGSQHVWLSLRAWNLDTSPAIVEAHLRFDREQCRVASPPEGCQPSTPLRIRTRFEQPEGVDYTQITGIAVVVPDPAPVEGQWCVLWARVTENEGARRSAEDARRVRVEWGTEVCGSSADGGMDAE
ncbi:MAG: hypothetical protein NZ898_10180 [Myxococcota bacterium]|nr:hypothetical protein [Myxococcota bacterium]MDW8363824.1 hypothetical protein [Myxococcales bacterium]